MTRSNSIIYVGNLPLNVRESELDKLFYSFGRIKKIDLKVPMRPPAYSFIEFEDSRDAEDAVTDRDGYSFAGERLRVEHCHGGRGMGPPPPQRRPPPRDRHYEKSYDDYEQPSRGSRGDHKSSRRESERGSEKEGKFPRSGGLGPSPYGPSRKTRYRVIITGLPQSCSWQDLKDHMRKGGEVTFADTYPDKYGIVGIVDYATYEDMKYAIRKLDGTQFSNPFHKNSIKVREDQVESRSRSRTRSRSRSRSYSRSAYHKSVSKSPYSQSKSRSRSLTRSKSRSKGKTQSPSSRSQSISGQDKSREPSQSITSNQSR